MTQVDLDDIMSSIRTGVEAESGKPPAGSADLVDQAAAEAAAAEAATPDDDDVLELTAADMAPQAAPTSAPAPTNDAAVADILGIPSLAPGENADDEFDKLLAEISAEKQTRAAEVNAVKEALLADIEPLGEMPSAAEAVIEPVAETPAIDVPVAPEAEQEPATETQPEAMPEMAQLIAADVAAPIAEVTMPATPATTHEMGMIAGADGGMQLTLPAEVLAMALRPMVQNWLNQNLSGVVERLVREEIAKLNG